MPKNFEREYILGTTTFDNTLAADVPVGRVVVVDGASATRKRFGVKRASANTERPFGITTREMLASGSGAVAFRPGEVVNVEVARPSTGEDNVVINEGERVSVSGSSNTVSGFASAVRPHSGSAKVVGIALSAVVVEDSDTDRKYIAVAFRPDN